ncbi:hypothetical protein BD770DRAFT_404282 [Pilaira anomala]|nr:hypothetical protein BD770DRAFT_404282 [Pilaira anomala]
MYRRIKSESRRGNHYILFHASLEYRSYRWYVGCVLFYFQHKNYYREDSNQFLVFVEVLKGNIAAGDVNTIPVVTLNAPGRPTKYAVISLNDIQRQVGLVQTSVNSFEHKVVSPYMIFNNNVKETAGQLNYI